jgi:CRISPR-associated protein Cas1
VLGPQHNDAAVRIAQALRVTDSAWCQQWALGVVRAKLARQSRTLKYFLAERPDARKPLFDALATLNAISHTLSCQSGEAPLDSLRGFEGAAARAYFGGLGGVMPPALAFNGRNRRPPRDPVNVCLSLGYTLLHAQAINACVTAGLDPLLGFYHRPAFGRESLASDLIEPLRPAIDTWAWQLLRARTLREEHFSTTGTDGGACLLGKAGRTAYYAEWALACKPWQRWLRGQAQALARDLRGVGSHWMAPADADDETC